MARRVRYSRAIIMVATVMHMAMLTSMITRTIMKVATSVGTVMATTIMTRGRRG